jgi:hypothetical protein
MDRSWMYTTALRRQYKEYRDGVLSFMNAAEEDRRRRNDKYMWQRRIEEEETTSTCVIHVGIARMRLCGKTKGKYTLT